ncbi:hypothetical protein EB796_015378 [Bugula neritina]|uniref:ZP domain-containing protein n=1 Tax=Bugula neritina TaxID=10212 RepID=A0A7J7JJ18_BUGNE|nr:hypothetical protein EB796_015378 [Bugula neritina]
MRGQQLVLILLLGVVSPEHLSEVVSTSIGCNDLQLLLPPEDYTLASEPPDHRIDCVRDGNFIHVDIDSLPSQTVITHLMVQIYVDNKPSGSFLTPSNRVDYAVSCNDTAMISKDSKAKLTMSATWYNTMSEDLDTNPPTCVVTIVDFNKMAWEALSVGVVNKRAKHATDAKTTPSILDTEQTESSHNSTMLNLTTNVNVNTTGHNFHNATPLTQNASSITQNATDSVDDQTTREENSAMISNISRNAINNEKKNEFTSSADVADEVREETAAVPRVLQEPAKFLSLPLASLQGQPRGDSALLLPKILLPHGTTLRPSSLASSRTPAISRSTQFTEEASSSKLETPAAGSGSGMDIAQNTNLDLGPRIIEGRQYEHHCFNWYMERVMIPHTNCHSFMSVEDELPRAFQTCPQSREGQQLCFDVTKCTCTTCLPGVCPTSNDPQKSFDVVIYDSSREKVGHIAGEHVRNSNGGYSENVQMSGVINPGNHPLWTLMETLSQPQSQEEQKTRPQQTLVEKVESVDTR